MRSHFSSVSGAVLASALASLSACAPTAPLLPAPARASDEALTEQVFGALRGDSARLEVFLRAMPKGGDLHTHLSGAIYAESFLRWAAEDGLCVDTARLAIVSSPCDAAAGRLPSAALPGGLRDRLIDAFSTRNYKPAVENGHERFFTTFDRFGLVSATHVGDMLAEVASRAASGAVRYVEIMHTAGGLKVNALGAAAGWSDDWGGLRERLLAAGLRDTLVSISREMDGDEARRDAALRCGTDAPDAGCAVTQRYLYQVLRAFPREQVFAQILGGFELTRSDPRFVGFNLVQPEDDRVAMDDYALHMRIIGFLRQFYPEVPVSLHAGELTHGLVPPEGLRFHIRDAVEVAGAKRIGHGVDVLMERDPDGLLRAMAARRVMVEINLTSNDVILGVTGARHPLRTYLAYGVPVALSTDDEGVSRSSMTLEYRKAVEEQGVDYRTLKAMARNSLEYAFVEGESLWTDFAALVATDGCSPGAGGYQGDACVAFRGENRKADLQVSLELALRDFEAKVSAGGYPFAR
ncbi:MAG TPA: hypothetical protein VLA36_12175 [Longimicrobiales bacterium]|nr:hypothetical protein [Longimicrobiales bacterium]